MWIKTSLSSPPCVQEYKRGESSFDIYFHVQKKRINETKQEAGVGNMCK